MRSATRPRARRVPLPGTAPGTLSVDPNAPRPVISVVAYGPDAIDERHEIDLDEALGLVGKQPVTWINVDGLGDAQTLSHIGRHFDLHRLVLEDVLNVPQRPKVEFYEKYVFMVTRMLTFGGGVQAEQVSLVLCRNALVTFQERVGDVFDPVRQRIREGKGRLRTAGPGYLSYTLLDAVVDHYFPVLEQFGELLEALEHQALHESRKDTIERIYASKAELLRMRRSIWPQRDMVHSILREESPLFEAEDRVHLQDVYDHVLRVVDLVESYREMSGGLMDLHLSTMSNRMNEVMKVLTLFASIFIPLGFVAGLYGMNFDTGSPWNMPELSWSFGYLFALGIMLLIALSLLVYFWRRGWIGK